MSAKLKQQETKLAAKQKVLNSITAKMVEAEAALNIQKVKHSDAIVELDASIEDDEQLAAKNNTAVSDSAKTTKLRQALLSQVDAVKKAKDVVTEAQSKNKSAHDEIAAVELEIQIADNDATLQILKKRFKVNSNADLIAAAKNDSEA
jgi:hypothetical protein